MVSCLKYQEAEIVVLHINVKIVAMTSGAESHRLTFHGKVRRYDSVPAQQPFSYTLQQYKMADSEVIR